MKATPNTHAITANDISKPHAPGLLTVRAGLLFF